MKTYFTITLIIFVFSNGYSQVTTDANASTTPTIDYVGWDNTITNPLRIKHENNYGIEFYTNTGAGTFGTPKMELESTGQLGLGTTSPTSWLHVVTTGASSTIAEEPLRTVVPSGQIGNWRMYRNATEYGSFISFDGGNAFYIQTPRGNLRFESGNGGSSSPGMEIRGGSGTDFKLS